ncbi:helix-turn-helix transcriptional regulator [Arsenophonus sp. PmNCSU2021_1]|uniref:helix-turn-helix transcriptional regulator n=1 Tax=Arsenophonus sp. PmNCSU2021_1 TaxID=3118989 RepID=UPI002FF17776
MSRDYAKKLFQIRKAEGMTQKAFSELTGVSLGTIQKYETGHQQARAEIMERVLDVEQFEKYSLWLTINKVAPSAGQIEPAFSLSGSEVSEKKDQRKSFHTKENGC